MVAEEPGGVLPGEEGGLPRARLGQALHPQGGVQGGGGEGEEEGEEVLQGSSQAQAVHEEEEHLSILRGTFATGG